MKIYLSNNNKINLFSLPNKWELMFIAIIFLSLHDAKSQGTTFPTFIPEDLSGFEKALFHPNYLGENNSGRIT